MKNRLSLKKLSLLQILAVFLLSLFICPTLSWANGDTVVTTSKKATPSKGKKVKKKKKKPAGKKKKMKKKPPPNLFMWGTGSYSKGRDNFVLSNSRSKAWAGTGGFNYQVNRELNLGINYAYRDSKNTTRVSQLTQRGKSTSKPHSVFLNASYNITREFGASFNFGYTYNPSHNMRVSSTTGAVTTSRPKTNVYSYSPSISYTKKVGNFKGRFQWGYSHSDSYRKATTDSNGRLLAKSTSHSNSFFTFAVFSYDINNVSEDIKRIGPFVRAGLDLSAENPRQRGRDGVFRYRRQEGWKSGAGVKFDFVNDMSAIAAWGISGGKSGRLNNSVSLTLRAGLFNL